MNSGEGPRRYHALKEIKTNELSPVNAMMLDGVTHDPAHPSSIVPHADDWVSITPRITTLCTHLPRSRENNP